jgi:hypothetical protein
MEWFASVIPVWNGVLPAGGTLGALPYGTGLLLLVGVVTALVPVLLVVRQALRGRSGATEAPRLRVLEGGRELRRRAA